MKKLYRSRKSRMIGGVAAGAADYFGIDTTVMRLLFALLGVVIPQFIIAYILALVIIPEEPAQVAPVAKSPSSPEGEPSQTADDILAGSGAGSLQAEPGDENQPARVDTVDAAPAKPAEATHEGDRSKQFLGYVLIGVGGLVLLHNVFPSYLWRMPFQVIRSWWPLGIIALGLALIFGALKGR